MKKLVFTAFAVIAFSGVVAAKNNDVKDNNKKESDKENLVTPDCDTAKFIAYVEARNAGFDHEFAQSSSYAIYFVCMGLEVPLPQ